MPASTTRRIHCTQCDSGVIILSVSAIVIAAMLDVYYIARSGNIRRLMILRFSYFALCVACLGYSEITELNASGVASILRSGCLRSFFFDSGRRLFLRKGIDNSEIRHSKIMHFPDSRSVFVSKLFTPPVLSSESVHFRSAVLRCEIVSLYCSS